jgi:hypothetical protein
VKALHLELLKDSQVVDARTLDAAQVARFATMAPESNARFGLRPFNSAGWISWRLW